MKREKCLLFICLRKCDQADKGISKSNRRCTPPLKPILVVLQITVGLFSNKNPCSVLGKSDYLSSCFALYCLYSTRQSHVETPTHTHNSPCSTQINQLCWERVHWLGQRAAQLCCTADTADTASWKHSCLGTLHHVKSAPGLQQAVKRGDASEFFQPLSIRIRAFH